MTQQFLLMWTCRACHQPQKTIKQQKAPKPPPACAYCLAIADVSQIVAKELNADSLDTARITSSLPQKPVVQRPVVAAPPRPAPKPPPKEPPGDDISELALQKVKKAREKIKKEGKERTEYPPEIMKRAMHVLKDRDPLCFMLNALESRHVGDHALKALNILSWQTPWLEGKDSLHTYPVGKSGSGKTGVIKACLELFDTEQYCLFTSLSPKALYYAVDSGYLKERQILVWDDMFLDESGIPIIKAFTTAGIDPSLLTVIDQKFVPILAKGKYSVSLTSVNPPPDAQLKNRFLLANPDESQLQDEAVYEHQKKYQKVRNDVIEDDVEVCRAMNRLLAEWVDDVAIHFEFTWPHKKDRRLYLFFLNLIRASTKIHRFQRENVGGQLIATKADFEVAALVWAKIAEAQMSKSGITGQTILQKLTEIGACEDVPADYMRMARELKISRTSVQRAVDDLEASGMIDVEKGERGKVIFWPSKNYTERLNLMESYTGQGGQMGRPPDDKVLWGGFNDGGQLAKGVNVESGISSDLRAVLL